MRLLQMRVPQMRERERYIQQFSTRATITAACNTGLPGEATRL
jgi:hypothetical protein